MREAEQPGAEGAANQAEGDKGAGPSGAGTAEEEGGETEEERAARRAKEDVVLEKAALARAVASAAVTAARPAVEEPPRYPPRVHWDYVMQEMSWMSVDFSRELVWKLNVAMGLAHAAARAAIARAHDRAARIKRERAEAEKAKPARRGTRQSREASDKGDAGSGERGSAGHRRKGSKGRVEAEESVSAATALDIDEDLLGDPLSELPGTPPLGEEAMSLLFYDCPRGDFLDICADLEKQDALRLEEQEVNCEAFERRLIGHRKLASAAAVEAEAARERERIRRAKEKLEKARRSIAANLHEQAMQGMGGYMDPSMQAAGLSKKGKRKLGKRQQQQLLQGMDPSGMFPGQSGGFLGQFGAGGSGMMGDLSYADAMGLKAGKKIKGMSKGMGMAMSSMLGGKDMSELMMDGGLGGKAKKDKKKKKKKKAGMVPSMFDFHSQMAAHGDPTMAARMGEAGYAFPGSMGMPGIPGFKMGDVGAHLGLEPKSKSKSKSKGKGKKGDKAASQAAFKLHGRVDPFDPVGGMLSFGDAKLDISQMLLLGGMPKVSAAKGKPSKKGGAGAGGEKSGISDLLKLQSRENKKKGSKGSSKSKSALAASMAHAEIPWSVAEDQVLCAIVYEFGSNWALVADVLCSAYASRGIQRAPSACRSRFKWVCSCASNPPGATAAEQKEQETCAAALKINKSNAKALLQHVIPMDEDTLKKHLDVIVSVTSKHRASKAHMEQQKSSKESMQVMDTHASHKNAQVVASRGQMLMNPGALCEYVHSASLNMQQAAAPGGGAGSAGAGGTAAGAASTAGGAAAGAEHMQKGAAAQAQHTAAAQQQLSAQASQARLPAALHSNGAQASAQARFQISQQQQQMQRQQPMAAGGGMLPPAAFPHKGAPLAALPAGASGAQGVPAGMRAGQMMAPPAAGSGQVAAVSSSASAAGGMPGDLHHQQRFMMGYSASASPAATHSVPVPGAAFSLPPVGGKVTASELKGAAKGGRKASGAAKKQQAQGAQAAQAQGAAQAAASVGSPPPAQATPRAASQAADPAAPGGQPPS